MKKRFTEAKMKNGVSTVAFLLLILFGFMFFPTSCGRKIGVDRFDFADVDVMAQDWKSVV